MPAIDACLLKENAEQAGGRPHASCVPYMCALYVCLIRTPYTYALHVCLVQEKRIKRQANRMLSRHAEEVGSDYLNLNPQPKPST